MKLFLIKIFFIAGLMFISVLFGMQQANEGIYKMKGYDDPDFSSAFTIKEAENGELKASVLGSDISSHNLEKKKEQLEEMKAYNFFSALGKGIADAITGAANKLFTFIADIANNN